MDPDATLKEIRELINYPTDFGQLIDLIAGLDHWITNGGFLPRDWDKDRK